MSLKMSPMVGQQVTERSCVLAVQNFKNMRSATSVLNIWDRLLVLEVWKFFLITHFLKTRLLSLVLFLRSYYATEPDS